MMKCVKDKRELMNEELQNSEWGLPGQQGHGLLAWLVLNAGWYAWLDLPEQEF